MYVRPVEKTGYSVGQEPLLKTGPAGSYPHFLWLSVFLTGGCFWGFRAGKKGSGKNLMILGGFFHQKSSVFR
jgi:hypothetical protein